MPEASDKSPGMWKLGGVANLIQPKRKHTLADGTSLELENGDFGPWLQSTEVNLTSAHPIEEPIVGRMPFIIYTAQEIRQSTEDFRSDKRNYVP